MHATRLSDLLISTDRSIVRSFRSRHVPTPILLGIDSIDIDGIAVLIVLVLMVLRYWFVLVLVGIAVLVGIGIAWY